MPIRFNCPSCGQELVLYWAHGGEEATCSHCGAQVKVPGTPNVAPPAAEPPQSSRSADAQAKAATPEQKPTPRTFAAEAGSIKDRYTNAYWVAKAVVRFGEVVKALGLILIGLIVVGALFAMNVGTDRPSVGVLLGGLVAGVVVGGVIYLLGVITAAQGQVMLAVLDTAVNTSPILSTSEKAGLVS